MTRTERDTFRSAREVLAHAIAYSDSIERRLGHADAPAQARTSLLQSAFAAEQSKLTTSLKRYLEEAPAEILDTFAQYSASLPDPLHEPASRFTPESLTQWLLDVHQPLNAMFSEVADAVVATPAQNVFENLTELIRSHEMHIVQAADGAQDL
jgi:hypothetical protein